MLAVRCVPRGHVCISVRMSALYNTGIVKRESAEDDGWRAHFACVLYPSSSSYLGKLQQTRLNCKIPTHLLPCEICGKVQYKRLCTFRYLIGDRPFQWITCGNCSLWPDLAGQ